MKLSVQRFPGFLQQSEVEEWIELSKTITYTTERDGFRMAPLALHQLNLYRNIGEFLDDRDPYGAYLLGYSVDTGKVVHVDPGMMHERLICMLQPAKTGGMLSIEGYGAVPLRSGDACIFRADVLAHSVTDVEEGERIALTIGRPI